VAKPIADRKFITGIDSETVGERQRAAGFLHDRPLISAGNQERSETEKKKGLESHERLSYFEISVFRRRPDCSILGNLESISKTRHIL
jgi:hypothetical protein